MIKPSNLKIKQHLVEMNKTGKLIARLPDTYWQSANEEQLKKAMNKLDNFTKSDIEIEDVEYYADEKAYVYTICICNFLRYGLVVDKDFNVQYHQLQWRNVD